MIFSNPGSNPRPSRLMKSSLSSRSIFCLLCLIAFTTAAITFAGNKKGARSPLVADPCVTPGVSIVTDPAGDTGTTVGTVPGAATQDIREVLIAEPGQADSVRRLAVTMKVEGDLSTLPPSGIWRVFFKPSTGTLTYFVGVFNDPTLGVQYNYGSVGTTTTTLGAADSGSISVANKTLTIFIADTKVGNPAAGTALTGIYGRTQTLVGAAGTGATPTHDLAPNTAPTTGTGSYTMVSTPCAVATPTPTPTPTPPPLAGAPRYFNYVSPQGLADSVGEPSIGSNYKSEKLFSNSMFSILNGGTTLFFGGFSPSLVRITFNDCSSPAGTLWEPKPLLTASTPRGFGDPILFTDHTTGRTFVSQLEGLTPAGSTTDITDNDGDSFLPSEGSSLPSDIDHQTIGGGPFHAPLTGTTLYPNGIYYASQSVADARAALSINGGFTFGPAFPMYTTLDCGGLHGHIKVAPDGTAYVPNNACGGTDLVGHTDGQQAVIFSEDNGVTWIISKIPGSTTYSDDDSSVGVSSDSVTIYEGMQSGDGHPRIAVGHRQANHTITWDPVVDVGAPSANVVVDGGPILNTTFPAVVAGDPNRAAFAFYGTETGGSNYNDPAFTGVWYLYIASTFDGGVTWRTQNVTPGDPVQRGGVCGSGACRNQLDFFDATIDREGRVLVGWDDGCVSASCINGGANDFTAKGVITRQSGGKRMFAASDPNEPAIPGAPLVTGGVNGANTVVSLSWPVPDNGGSPITGYKVSRGPSATGPFTLLATTPVNNYTDTTFNPLVQNFYIVTAVNAIGEGPYCGAVHPTVIVAPNPCVVPGVLVDNDLNPDGTDNDAGANTPPDPRVNVRQLFIAEPFFGAGVNKLVFTMQMQPSPTFTTPPPSSQWYIVWQAQNPTVDFDRYYVAMKTDAAGALSFEYGKFGVPLDATNPNPNANVPVKLGDADSGSYNVTTGVVTIILSNSKAENVSAGGSLSRVNVRTYLTRPDSGPKTQGTASDITGDGNYTLVGNASCATPPLPVSAVSAKTHGAAGVFDVNLPLTGNRGIECRTGGASGNHQMVVTFAAPVTLTSAMVSSGTGSVSSTTVSGNQVFVNLTGVTNAQNITVTLVGVNVGANFGNVAVPMGVLLGDTNANKTVNSTDVSQTKLQSGTAANDTNFRTDVTINGVINSSDISTVKSKSGTGIP